MNAVFEWVEYWSVASKKAACLLKCAILSELGLLPFDHVSWWIWWSHYFFFFFFFTNCVWSAGRVEASEETCLQGWKFWKKCWQKRLEFSLVWLIADWFWVREMRGLIKLNPYRRLPVRWSSDCPLIDQLLSTMKFSKVNVHWHVVQRQC